MKSFIKTENITCKKDIFRLCKMMFPSYISGLYDGKLHIEISTDIVEGEVVIEQDDNQNNRTNILSKSEFLELYRGR